MGHCLALRGWSGTVPQFFPVSAFALLWMEDSDPLPRVQLRSTDYRPSVAADARGQHRTPRQVWSGGAQEMDAAQRGEAEALLKTGEAEGKPHAYPEPRSVLRDSQRTVPGRAQ